jgi:hypothetical protein
MSLDNPLGNPKFKMTVRVSSSRRPLFDLSFNELATAQIRSSVKFLSGNEPVGRFDGTGHSTA